MTSTVLVDTCTIVNFAAVDRLDLLEAVLDGCGRWTETASFETDRAAEYWPHLRSASIVDWLGEPLSPNRSGDAEAIFQLRRQLGGVRRAPREHLAEAEAIHLILCYPEFAGAMLLTDDRSAGDLAAKRGIHVWMSMTVLSHAYLQGHIGCPAAHELLRDMAAAGRGPYVPDDHGAVCP